MLCGTVLLVLTALGAGRVPRLAVAALAAVGFVVLARPEPSVLRAAAMGLVGLVGLAGSRRAAGVPALAVAVVLTLTSGWEFVRDVVRHRAGRPTEAERAPQD